MLGFHPLIGEPLAAVPAPDSSSSPAYGSFETAPMGGFALGTDGSTSTGTSTNILQSHPASGTIAVTGTAAQPALIQAVTATATLTVAGTATAKSPFVSTSGAGAVEVTSDVTASGVFQASTDAPSTTVFTVTVASGTNVYGSGNKYFINGSIATPLTLYEGNTYRFDQSHSSNSNHPLRFSSTEDGTHTSGGSEYTTGVTTAGTAGSSGAYTEITVPDGGPPLYFYCVNHSQMGNFANTPTTITAAITGTCAAGRLTTASPSPASFAVTASAAASAIEIVLLANVDITVTGTAGGSLVRGVDSTTGNDLVVTHDARASALFGMVGSGDVASTATGAATRVLGMVGSGTAAVTGTALVLPDPTNYGSKSVVSSTTSADTTFTGTATAPVRVQYAVGTGDLVVIGTSASGGVYSVQGEGEAAITGTALHNAGQKYVLGSGSVSVTGSNPELGFVQRVWGDPTTITASATAAPYVRVRQRDGIADAPVVTGTGDARRFRLVDGAGDVASTATGIASAVLGAQGAGDAAATATATAIKIRIMSPASASIAVTETAEALRVRGVIGSATGAATATADGVVLTLKLMQAAADVAVTEVANVYRIRPLVGAAAIAATGTIDVKAIFAGAALGKITCGSFAQIFRSVTSERTDAIVQRYSRRVLPTGELRDTLGNEFQNIERTLSSVTEATILLADAEPEQKRRGMVRYAVSPWIPVSGHSGLVVYDGNTWSAG